MKPLSETYKENGIAFKFPITILDTNGKKTYYEDSDGFCYKYEYDDNVKTTYYEDNAGFWNKWEYDDNGNQTYSENSDGYWYKWEYDENGNRTYYENSNGTNTGNPKSKPCAGKVIEVDGIKYKLSPVK